MKYMVSFQWLYGDCGNRCGTLEEVNAFTVQWQHLWKSYSFFSYVEGQAIADLTPIV